MINYEKLSDASLIALLRKKDPEAFIVIYNKYWALLFCHATKMLKDEEVARKVVQKVFIDLWEEESIAGSLSNYLYSSVRYGVLSAARQSKLKDQYIESLMEFRKKEDEDLTEDQIAEELATRIEASIDKLPEKYRAAFELSRKHDENTTNKLV